MNEFELQDLVSCLQCRCLVCKVTYIGGPRAGQTVLWDPSFTQRRMLVSEMGFPQFIEAGQVWGDHYDQYHQCPPAEVLARGGATRDARI